MSLIVQKFGGTSVTGSDRIKRVAQIVHKEITYGNKVIVVVSAMSGVTNSLVNQCLQISCLKTKENMREYDAAVSSGENITSALLALELQNIGFLAKSIQAWQIPIIGSNMFGSSLIKEINAKHIFKLLDDGIIPVIAGFQSVDDDGNIMTLGKGGSDITAALVTAATKATRCDIYTDVEGVFSADPRVVHNAHKIERISTDHMLTMSASGSKVLHPRAALALARYGFDMRILSSFNAQDEGTYITSKENKKMEQGKIVAISANKNIMAIKCNVNDTSNRKLILERLYELDVIIDKIEYDAQEVKIRSEIHYQNKVVSVMEKMIEENTIANFAIDTNCASVTLIGYSLKNDVEITKKILETLYCADIKVRSIESSENALQITVEDKDTEKTTKLLHDEFFPVKHVA